MQWVPESADLAIYLVGWSLGWLLFWAPRPLPQSASDPPRRGIAVVVPARNEADALPFLIGPLLAQLGPADEFVVVDDHSDDTTAAVAAELGARVITPPPLPDGWLGKPHACWAGVAATTAPTLVFLDADVRPGPDLLDRLDAARSAAPDALVSVQPWHQTEALSEQASVLCNVTALMGCGAFGVAGRRVRTTVAFGPVLCVDRARYDAVGGHAHEGVRAMHTEDIGLARALGRSELYTGAPETRFRMYPDGIRATIGGWSRSLATGARYTPWWLAVATLCWVWSLAGGWIAAPIVYPLSALQLWILGRRTASIHPLTAIFFPVAVLVFTVIVVRSLITLVVGRRVSWKGREVPSR